MKPTLEIVKVIELLLILITLFIGVLQLRESHMAERIHSYTDIASKINSNLEGIQTANTWLGLIQDDTSLISREKKMLRHIITERSKAMLIYRLKTLNTKNCSKNRWVDNNIADDCKLLSYIHELSGNEQSRTDFSDALKEELFQEKYYLTGLWSTVPIKDTSEYCNLGGVAGSLYIFKSPHSPAMKDAWVLVLGDTDTLINTVLLKSKINKEFPNKFTSYEQTSWDEPGLKIQTEKAFANWTKMLIDCQYANQEKAHSAVI